MKQKRIQDVTVVSMSQISLGLTNKEKGLGVIKSKVEMHELGA
jgi:hypothetical protein